MTAAPHGLYVILDPAVCSGGEVWPVAVAALRAGVGWLQYRDKLREKGRQLADLERILPLCREHGATLVVNDHADLAAVAGAAGVHVGQKDLPVRAVRSLLGPAAVVGTSTNNPDEARAAEAAGASYVAVGCLFPTTTKHDTRPAGLETVKAVRGAVRVPVVGIGGITAATAALVLRAGADGVVVSSAVCAAPDPEAAARELLAAVASAREEAHVR